MIKCEHCKGIMHDVECCKCGRYINKKFIECGEVIIKEHDYLHFELFINYESVGVYEYRSLIYNFWRMRKGTMEEDKKEIVKKYLFGKKKNIMGKYEKKTGYKAR